MAAATRLTLPPVNAELTQVGGAAGFTTTLSHLLSADLFALDAPTTTILDPAMKISVVTPLFKSAPHIEELCSRSIKSIARTGADSYEIILVNDGSPDDGLAIAKKLASTDPNIVVIDLSRNFGQHRALNAGIDQATGDYVFICDSDLEEEPEWIAEFYNVLQAQDCDVVFGIMASNKGSIGYRLLRRIFYFMLNKLSGVDFPIDGTSARLMSRRYVDAYKTFEEREIFMIGIWHMVGFKQVSHPVVKHDTSPTTYSLPQLASLFVNGLIAFSTFPLVAVAIAGLGISALAFLSAIYLVIRQVFFEAAMPGWASIVVSIFLMGGISVFCIGITAIYVAKIYLEVKNRPSAIIRERYQLSSAEISADTATVDDRSGSQ